MFRMQVLKCGCGAEIQAVDGAAALEQHKRDVHGLSAAASVNAALCDLDGKQVDTLMERLKTRKAELAEKPESEPPKEKSARKKGG